MDTTEPRDDAGPLDEQALRRVTAADPAVGVELDTAALHATLAAATGVPLDGDQLAAARARRSRTRWLQAAAAVAAVAVVGAGGYAVGSRTDGPAAAAITLDTSSSEGEAATGLSGRTLVSGDAPDSAASTLPAPMLGGHLVFHAKDLSEAGGTQAGWAYDAASVYSQATAQRVADVFGVTGKAREDYGWTIGPLDGSRPTVTLTPDGTASVSYYDPTRDPWSCEVERSAPDEPSKDGEVTGQAASGGGASSGAAGEGDDKASQWGTGADEPLEPGVIVPMASDCGGGSVSAADATATVSATLEDLGLDAHSYEIEATEDATASASVVAYQVVDDQRTGATWSFTVMADGVQAAYGPMAPLVALGDYDVVSPTDAVARLNDPRFTESFGGGVVPMIAAREGGAAELGTSSGDAAKEPSDVPTVPATVEPGADLAWPVTDVFVTQARLGITMRTLDDGAAVLMPAYELGDGQGSTWSVVAVVDAQLSFSG